MSDKRVSKSSDNFDPIPPQIRQMLEAQGIELPPDPTPASNVAGQMSDVAGKVCPHLFTMPPDTEHTTSWCRHCGAAV